MFFGAVAFAVTTVAADRQRRIVAGLDRRSCRGRGREGNGEDRHQAEHNQQPPHAVPPRDAPARVGLASGSARSRRPHVGRASKPPATARMRGRRRRTGARAACRRGRMRPGRFPRGWPPCPHGTGSRAGRGAGARREASRRRSPADHLRVGGTVSDDRDHARGDPTCGLETGGPAVASARWSRESTGRPRDERSPPLRLTERVRPASAPLRRMEARVTGETPPPVRERARQEFDWPRFRACHLLAVTGERGHVPTPPEQIGGADEAVARCPAVRRRADADVERGAVRVGVPQHELVRRDVVRRERLPSEPDAEAVSPGGIRGAAGRRVVLTNCLVHGRRDEDDARRLSPDAARRSGRWREPGTVAPPIDTYIEPEGASPSDRRTQPDEPGAAEDPPLAPRS